MTTVFQNDFRIQLFFRIRKTTNPIIDDYCKVAVSEIQSIPEYGPYPPDTAFSGKSPLSFIKRVEGWILSLADQEFNNAEYDTIHTVSHCVKKEPARRAKQRQNMKNLLNSLRQIKNIK